MIRGNLARWRARSQSHTSANLGLSSMNARRTIEIHIVMDESGAFVVADDADVAAERAEEELGKMQT
jgi:hypothetical protein